MQTFLPYPIFRESAAVLDRARLGKQRVEAFQIIETLTGLRQNWRNHPAVQMWTGSEFKLAEYGMAMCDEWIHRGYEDNMKPRFLELLTTAMSAERLIPGRNDHVPWWLGLEAFHQAHRSQLLRRMPEHYRKYWPDERDDLDYLWPPGYPLDDMEKAK